MSCARCAQPIEKGQRYQEARRFKYTESESMQSGHVDPGVWVHDSPCPNAHAVIARDSNRQVRGRDVRAAGTPRCLRLCSRAQNPTPSRCRMEP